jgi:hypothetical protein
MRRLWNTARLFGMLAQNRDLRNVCLAFLGLNGVWYGVWIELLIYAYRATGPASVGIVAMVLLIPSAIFGSGALLVTRAGEHLNTMRDPGDGVGEIALLFDVPRTATVTALEDAELLVLERADFLTAVTGYPEVARSAERIASDRMPA